VSAPPYQKWLDEDVHWIITDQERADFNKLMTDQQRDDFVRQFWERRNPKPGATENTFKEEHYRRLAYSNTHFAAREPGYKSDRGHLYIAYGKPDFIDSHPTLSPPTEVWHYGYVEGIGRDVQFKLVDECRCGDYRIPVEKEELQKYTPK
jgi:GWxTD domain-containing protein